MTGDPSQAVKDMMELMGILKDVELKEKKDGKFYFQIYLTDRMKETGIEVLDLSVRAYHSLKRYNYDTIGQLTDRVSCNADLAHIRNCGGKTITEILAKLFLYQYHSLEPECRERYLLETVVYNLKKRSEGDVRNKREI